MSFCIASYLMLSTLSHSGSLSSYTKGKVWEQEREYRIASGKGRDKTAPFEYVKFAERELVSLIFGYRMESADRTKFARLARAVNARVAIREAVGKGFALAINDV